MSIKASLAKFLGVSSLLVVCLCIFSLIWLARHNWGASQYFIMALEAILVIVGMIILKLLMIPPLSLLTGYLRMTLFFALVMLFVGGIMSLSYDNQIGWVLVSFSLIIIFPLYYRVDLLFKILFLESQLYKAQRIKIGAIFSIAIFTLLAFTHGITNSTTWLMTVFWFCTAIGYLTIKSRMAVAVNFIPGGATKEDRKAFLAHYEKTRSYTVGDMIHNQLERDADMAVNAKNHRAFFSMILFLISYYIFSVFVGFASVFLYVYQTIQTRSETT